MSTSLRLEKGARTFVINGQPLARGGEAAIYQVPDQPALVAKVYYQPTAEHADKVAAMIAAPPTDPMAGRGHVSIAWPVDRLLEAGTPRFVGFVMPRVDQVRPILEFYNPASRLQVCPLFHFGYLLRTARNLAAAVRALHERGYVIGDLNESNILVNNMALVTLVDTDSFQVPHSRRVHRCPVGKPEYTPPELQGTRFADFDRGPEHDAFALAIMVFQLLMQGIHPFAGRFTGQGEPSALSERIAAGHWPYVRGRRVPYGPNPHAPPLDIVPSKVLELMVRCFEEGHARSALRPSAAAWQQALQESELELVACPANAQHRFQRQLKACPWCVLAARQGRDLFPSVADVQAGRVGPRPVAAKAPEVIQVPLAPAPMARDNRSRDVPAVAVMEAPPVAIGTATSRPRDCPASAVVPDPARRSSVHATQQRHTDVQPDLVPSTAPAGRRLLWSGVAIVGVGTLLLGLLAAVVVAVLTLTNNWPGSGGSEGLKIAETDDTKAPAPTKLFPSGPRRFLSDLQEFDVRAGKWPLGKGETGGGHLIKVAGHPSPHGLGMHPPWAPDYASVKYRLDGEAEGLSATVAINDSTNWCWSPAKFTVLGDGVKLWESSKMIAHNHARSEACEVSIEGVNILELRVQCVNGSDGVHAVWVEPCILQKGAVPKKDDPKVPPGKGAGATSPLDKEVVGLLRDTVQKRSFVQTEMVGFPHDAIFEDVPPQGALLIGFEVGLGKFAATDVIHSLQPIYWTEKGEVRGQTRGKPAERPITVKAKDGYAVGAVSLSAHLVIDHMRITFMKADKKFLDVDQAYDSESLGSNVGQPRRILGGGGAMVVGICGRANGQHCNALGLVLRGKRN
jgi:hypothetical protein